MDHRGEQELAAELAEARQRVVPGQEYIHYKSPDKTYKVIGLAILEANDEPCVIYQAQYGEGLTLVRALSSWLEDVDWQGQTIPRFKRI